MLEILSPLASANQEGMDVERFTAELPGLAAGRQTLFDEMARLAKADVELTVSGHADLYRGVSPESGSPFPGPWRTDRVPCLREPMDCLHPAIVEAISGICEEFEFYGWRRVRAELRHRGLIVNHKKVRRLMREHDLQPRRRRYVATTDSDHDQPIYPNRAKDLAIDGPDQLWVADITYVAIREGFAYVAVILDAWSRRAIGYAISRSIDMRLTLAALNTAVERRKPPPGCIHHSDRGSQ